MNREQMIYECRRKLPYPISWYDKISDRSLYNVWYKHVVCGIPINKKEQKYKELNDKEREKEYHQLTLDEYFNNKKKEEDNKPITSEEFARRCLNRGEINFITISVYGEDFCRLIVDNGLTIEEYYDIMNSITNKKEEKYPYIVQNGDTYILTDSGEYELLEEDHPMVRKR